MYATPHHGRYGMNASGSIFRFFLPLKTILQINLPIFHVHVSWSFAALSKLCPNIDHFAMQKITIFHHLTMTCNPSVSQVKVNSHAKNQGQRSNSSNRRAYTNTQMDGQTLPNVLSPCYKVDNEVLLYIHLLGANPDQPNDFGMTPMALALRSGHVTCVRTLMYTGSIMSDPMMTWLANSLNTTAQHSLVWSNYSVEMIKLLLVRDQFQIVRQSIRVFLGNIAKLS